MREIKRIAALLVIIVLCLSSVACGGGVTDTPASGEAASSFTVYYLDVGQADSALVLCDGAAMLIDGGNVADSNLIYSFLEKHGIAYLDYIVGTHAHEDHIGGLAGALNYASVGVALCPVTEFDSNAFNNFVKYLGEQGKFITVPTPGGTFKLGSADVTILGPVEPSDEPNDTSIVLKITYGETSFLFTGDAEHSEETDILKAGYDLSATVLKVGHHGSETSTSYPFLREIMPEYAVISCGEDNSYGHPHDDLLSRLRDADVTVYRTDMQGTITCTSDEMAVTFTTERNANAQTNPTDNKGGENSDDAKAYYIGNISSHILHSPACGNLPLEKNRIIFHSLDEALAQGYSRHKACLP
jgi:competence protein ComEC